MSAKHYGLAPLLLATAAHAAPDEALLGKAEGYPICGPTMAVPERCLVSLMSRRDEISPSRKVARGDEVRMLKRLDPEPPIRVDEYLARHRTTGLLILKGDVIVTERYQYDRTPEHRMTSMSMA